MNTNHCLLIFRFILVISACTNFVYAQGSKTMITITEPVIDGNLDTAWANAFVNNIGNPIAGTVSSTSDLSGNWRGIWDSQNLYLFVDVTDDIKFNDSIAQWWEDDLVEIYIDANNSKNTNYDGVDDYQYVFRWNDPAVLETKLSRIAGVTFARVDTTTGYQLEIRFPWSTLGQTPEAGNVIGLEVMLNDDDDGGSRERKLAWHGTSDTAWQNPSLFGVTELESEASAIINAPTAPSALVLAAISASQINLAWTDNATNETRFKIERKTGSGGDYAQIATTVTNVSSFSDLGLTAVTDYYYRVRASNSAGDSAFSLETNVATLPLAPLPTALLAYEGFDQPAADFIDYSGSSSFGFADGSNWGSSGFVNDNSSVIIPGLNYLGMTTIGGLLNTPRSASWARFGRALGIPAQNLFNVGSTGYVSLLFRATDGTRWDFGQNDEDVGFGVSGGLIGIMSGVDDYIFHSNGITVPLNTTNLLVCKIQRLESSTIVSLYLNPTANTLENAPSFTYTYPTSIGFLMSAYKEETNVDFDEIRVSATFQAAIPVSPNSFSQWAVNKGLIGANALPGADPDADGVSNLLEYALGSEPLAALSANLPQVQVVSNNVQISFTPVVLTGLTYIIQASSDLFNWTDTDVTSSLTINQVFTYTDTQVLSTSGPSRRFLRLRVNN